MDGLDLCLAVLKINQNELTLGPYRQTLADNTSDWFSSLKVSPSGMDLA